MSGKITTGLVRESRLALSVAGSSNVALTEAQAENGVQEYTGALTGNINVTIPDVTAAAGTSWLVYNNTTGAFTLTLKTVSGTGVALLQGRKTRVFSDGTNLVAGLSDMVVVDGWYTDDVGGTAGPTVMTRFGAGTAFPTAYIALRPGSITGVSVKSNAARTAGTCTVEVYKNAVATGLTAQLNATDTTFKSGVQLAGADTFVAGDELDVRFTVAAWTPTTADIRAGIELEF